MPSQPPKRRRQDRVHLGLQIGTKSYAALMQRAEAHQISLAELVRRIIDDWVAQHGGVIHTDIAKLQEQTNEHLAKIAASTRRTIAKV